MKSNVELFAETWNLLKGKWLWRVMAVALTLSLVMQIVNIFLHTAYQLAGLTTLTDLTQTVLTNFKETGQLVLPAPEEYREVFVSYGFELFITLIFGAIVAWGIAHVALKATRDDGADWFGSAFGGFRNPLGFAWLQFVLNFRIFLWFLPYLLASAVLFGQTGSAVHYLTCLPLVLLGCVALYRYRLVWYLKNDFPELTASQCLAESARRMVGYKWKCFCFGLMYLGILLLFVLAFGVALSVVLFVGGQTVGALLAIPMSCGALFFTILWLVHLIVSHAVFYWNLPPPSRAGVI